MNIFLHFELESISEIIDVIDKHIQNLVDAAMSDPEGADSFGILDSIEEFTGMGFVACQAYLAHVSGILKVNKTQALQSGPNHSCGYSKAQIINHAANYWKHKEEWWNERNGKQRQKIVKAFDAIGFPIDVDYPLSGILAELCSPQLAAFTNIVDELKTWTNDLLPTNTSI